MRKTIKDLVLLRNIRLNPDNHLLIFKVPGFDSDIKPGQFANIEAKYSTSTFLRRPFSIHNIDPENETIHFLIKRVGEGTRHITDLKEGESVSVVFPLGHGFTLPERDEKVLLIGGGCGVAPLMMLARAIRPYSEDIHILLGARSAKDLVELDEYSQMGKLHITTEDGTAGEKGFVTQHSIFKNVSEFNRIYTCGPEPMMKAVAGIAMKNNIWCEVSLENMMACGFGVCLCCVTETKEGNKSVCTHGPVFNVNDLKW
ncbi:MAG: dihydroorotate dehydrogenase electron transfer subunit [Bacteroidota bacterium]|nr:dihydroorotate dehydrogenase electron transfer subunit [Bacteroidota bacterium]